MTIVFLGTPALAVSATGTICVADEFGFGVALRADPDAVGVFLARSKEYAVALVRNARVDDLRNPLYCLMWGPEADHHMIAAVLNAGADQVEKFPVHVDLFNAQIAAVRRRGHGDPDPIIRFGGMEFNQNTRCLTKDGKIVHLTEAEANLLYAVAAEQGRSMSKAQILDVMYGMGDDVPEIKIVDVFVCKLRRKMIAISGGLDFIMTVWGHGYAFREDGFVPNFRKTVDGGAQRFEIERGPRRTRRMRLEEAAE